MASQIMINNRQELDAFLLTHSRLARRKEAVEELVKRASVSLWRIGLKIGDVSFAEDGTATGNLIKTWPKVEEGTGIHEVTFVFRAGARKGQYTNEDTGFDLMTEDEAIMVSALANSGFEGFPVNFMEDTTSGRPVAYDITIEKCKFGKEDLFAWLELKLKKPGANSETSPTSKTFHP